MYIKILACKLTFNFIGFEQVGKRAFYFKTCFGPLVKLVCYKDIRTICGTRNRYSYYLCLSNKLSITLQNEHRFSNVSILLSYKIVLKLAVPFQLFDDQTYLLSTKTWDLPVLHKTYIEAYISHLYSIWTAHGNGIATQLSALPMRNETNVFVKIYDGPVLARSFSLYLLSTRDLKYKAGFWVTIGFEVIDTIIHPSVSVSYKLYSLKKQEIDLREYPETKWMTSIDTTKREHKQVLYYKYLTVRIKVPNFVQITFTNLTKFSDPSQGCEDGGFVLSDHEMYHHDAAGPFCTQHGTEPLVNSMRTYYSSFHYITIIIYSYTFQMEVMITFQQTPCQGITNPCYRLCDQYERSIQVHRYQNYYIDTSYHWLSCNVAISMHKDCVVVQKIPEESIACNITIVSLVEQIRATDFRVTDNIRYVSPYSQLNLFIKRKCFIISKTCCIIFFYLNNVKRVIMYGAKNSISNGH